MLWKPHGILLLTAKSTSNGMVCSIRHSGPSLKRVQESSMTSWPESSCHPAIKNDSSAILTTEPLASIG